ncbi:Fis family transcriptional regulator [Pseudoxanthomonas jiangsuensis]|uniref:sigma-54 interaction domain-containing protein n=1 Tax=Pseudoxanthomonas jiangsuensis TaxID=619688 RepID=UPI001391D895|nr:sigma-54 dependent transcriptional regulator [Pseudoxanthomonas jiangsuensis]KAF1696215.1 Fis family transcriptional regulator [Pseudoxanthomonas jiangsuensis]
MVAVPDIRKRCLIWLGRPTPREREVLAAAGWELRVVDDPASARIGLRGSDLVAGLVDLRGAAPAWRAAMHELLARHPELPLASLGDEHDDELPGECLLSLREPLDLDQVRGLQRIAEGEGAPSACGPDGDCLVGRSPALLQVRASLNKFAPVELPVLVTGETGTGKELAARALHEMSPRARGPFIAVNCGALPPSLVQAELFGHERGAFTGAAARRIGLFEAAHGGTIFLDEVGDLPLDAQTNLLRVLQEGTLERIGSHQSVRVDVRVLAATHVDLEQAVARGRFRQDLYYRLDVLRLHMPPLRERGDDVELLARHFLEAFRRQHQVRARAFDPGARRALRAHAWPGNVRELLNRVRRAAVVSEGELIPAEALQLAATTVPSATAADGLDDVRIQAEREAILATLRESGFNVSECARRLRVSRVTVYRLCRKHQLELEALRV